MVVRALQKHQLLNSMFHYLWHDIQRLSNFVMSATASGHKKSIPSLGRVLQETWRRENQHRTLQFSNRRFSVSSLSPAPDQCRPFDQWRNRLCPSSSCRRGRAAKQWFILHHPLLAHRVETFCFIIWIDHLNLETIEIIRNNSRWIHFLTQSVEFVKQRSILFNQ